MELEYYLLNDAIPESSFVLIICTRERSMKSHYNNRWIYATRPQEALSTLITNSDIHKRESRYPTFNLICLKVIEKFP